MLDQAIGERWKKLSRERSDLERSIAAELKAVSAKIEPMRTLIDAEIYAIEDAHGDLQTCEHCSKVDAVEDMNSNDEGCWFCSECVDRWRADLSHPEAETPLTIAEHDALVSQT